MLTPWRLSSPPPYSADELASGEMNQKRAAVLFAISGAVVALLASCTSTGSQVSPTRPSSVGSSAAPPTEDHASLGRQVNPPAQPPTASLVAANDSSVTIAQGLQYQAQWLENGKLVNIGGREPVEWPAAVVARSRGQLLVTIGSSVKPQGITIQVFNEISMDGIPVGRPVSTIDCSSSSFLSDTSCHMSEGQAGILMIPIPPTSQRGDVYVTEFVSWLDNRGLSAGVETVGVTWLYHLIY